MNYDVDTNIELSNQPLTNDEIVSKKQNQTTLIFAIISLLCGMLSLLLSVCCCGQIIYMLSYILATVLAITAVIFAIIAMKKASKNIPTAIIGLIFGTIVSTYCIGGILFQIFHFIASLLMRL